MRILALLGVLMASLTGYAGQPTEAEFKRFIKGLESAASEGSRKVIEEIYSDHYIASEIYLHKTPDTDKTALRAEYAQWFIDHYINDSEVLEHKDEIFTLKDGIYKWSRQAIYKNSENGWSDWNYSFVSTDQGFQVEPHDTHPSPTQLVELGKMKNVYALYFSMGNVATFDLIVNGKTTHDIEPFYQTVQAHDLVLGDNEFSLIFKKIDADKPIEVAVSLIFIARDEAVKRPKNDSIIHLIGKALAVSDVWNELTPTDEARVVFNTENFTTRVKLD